MSSSIIDNQSAEIKVPAVIKRVIWSNRSENFVILDASINESSRHYTPDQYPDDWKSSKKVVIKSSSFSELSGKEGKPIVFLGRMTVHPKYGQQLAAVAHFADVPDSRKTMVAYLQTMPMVGKRKAKMLVDAFGHDKIGSVIETNPESLCSTDAKLSREQALEIQKRWKDDQAARDTYLWCADHWIGFSIGKMIVQQFGTSAISVIENDPYSLIRIKGIGFKAADEIAFKAGRAVVPEQRAWACITHVLDDAMASEGHLCLPVALMKMRSLDILTKTGSPPETDYNHIVGEASLHQDFVIEHRDGADMISLKWVHDMDASIAQVISVLSGSSSECRLTDADLDAAEAELNMSSVRSIILNEQQRKAVLSAFGNRKSRITVITGGAGSGKSTLCRCICTLAIKNNMTLSLMTPTGKAAKVLTQKTGVPAKTIHRSLNMRPEKLSDIQPIASDIVILDEFSMCGIDVVYPVMLAVKDSPNVHLVIVGDHQQLPSVGAGNFLSDIMRSGAADVVKLDRIYRQDSSSYISIVAENVAKGLTAFIPADAADISYSECLEEADIPPAVNRALESLASRGISLDDIHIVAAMKRGAGGVSAVNKSVQDFVLNARRSQARHAVHCGSKFNVGDRVMHTENNYQLGIFNGEVGVVADAGVRAFSGGSAPEPYIDVAYDDLGKHVVYHGSMFDGVMLAWCTTVHKYQGSQCPHIIFAAPKSHSWMLTRELSYTAITRAEKSVAIIGTGNAWFKVHQRSSSSSRYTMLAEHIAASRLQAGFQPAAGE